MCVCVHMFNYLRYLFYLFIHDIMQIIIQMNVEHIQPLAQKAAHFDNWFMARRGTPSLAKPSHTCPPASSTRCLLGSQAQSYG